jgi:hypothetical protein
MTKQQELHPMILDDARDLLRKLPFTRRLARLLKPQDAAAAFASSNYWEERYRDGGTSGAGSYGRLACFKAEILNEFVAEHRVDSVIEFGCGDGAQLELAQYPRYTGLDVSQKAVALCREKFSQDPTKRFLSLSEPGAAQAKADLAMSLDVIYHLVEDETYERYMRSLVAAAGRFICVYSSNLDKPGHAPHIRHRCFTDWIAANAPGFRLIARIPNRYPEDPGNPEETSWADFYFFARMA